MFNITAIKALSKNALDVKKENRYQFSIQMASDKPNRNGRIYTPQVCEDMITAFNESPGELLGMLGSTDTQSIDIKKVSHKVVGLKLDLEGSITCTIDLLNTPSGQEAKKLLDEPNTKLCVAPKGIGQVIDGVVSDYKLISLDLVKWSAFDGGQISE